MTRSRRHRGHDTAVNIIVQATTALASVNSAADLSSYDSDSWTTPANKLILGFATSRRTASTPNTPTMSGNGLTWVAVANILYSTEASPVRRITLFRTMGASPSAGVTTIDFAAQTQLDCVAQFVAIDNVDTSGTNGSAAVVQSATDATDSPGTTAAPALAAFGSGRNGTFVCCARSAGATFSLPAEFFSSTVSTTIAGTSINNVLTPTVTNSSGADLGAIAIEVKAA